MASMDGAKEAGESVLGGLRVSLAERAAALLRKDPERAASAVEMGLVDRTWMEEPGRHPIRTATPVEVVQRFLERSVEQRPSALAAIGLNAIEMLSWNSDRSADGGTPAPCTIVFTDLEGFTQFTATSGDEAANELITEHHRVVGPVVRSRGGRLVKRIGDGLMLTFPEPAAAVLAALELLDTAPEPLRLRAGVHVGEAVTSRNDVIGHVVNVAARVTESAKGGQVLVTSDVRDAAGDVRGVRFGRARSRHFKGVNERVLVCAAHRDEPHA